MNHFTKTVAVLCVLPFMIVGWIAAVMWEAVRQGYAAGRQWSCRLDEELGKDLEKWGRKP